MGGINDLQRQILQVIKGAATNAMGVGIQQISNTLHKSPHDVRAALEFLSNEGHVYTTIDEDHFLTTS
jgi:replication factor A2